MDKHGHFTASFLNCLDNISHLLILRYLIADSRGQVMGLDIEAIRADFPILDRVLPNGKKLVYFDNAATSQKPQVVIDAMSRYYEEYNSNAHRANHTLADEATTALEEARSKISRYFGTTPENMIYTSGATEAINLVPMAGRDTICNEMTWS